MNRQTQDASARASTLPPSGADTDFDALLAPPHTLFSLAAALARCPHPDRCRSNGVVTALGDLAPAEPMTWCAACGAVSIGRPFGDPQWIQPALVQQFEPKHFEEIAVVTECVRSVSMTAANHSADIVRQHAEFEQIAGGMRALLTLTMLRDVKRLALARTAMSRSEEVSP